MCHHLEDLDDLVSRYFPNELCKCDVTKDPVKVWDRQVGLMQQRTKCSLTGIPDSTLQITWTRVPWSRKIPHVAEQHPLATPEVLHSSWSPCSRVREPQLFEAWAPRACAPQWEARAAQLERSPDSQQLDKAWAQLWWPSTAMNQWMNKKKPPPTHLCSTIIWKGY